MKTFTRDYRIPLYNSEGFDRYFGGMKPCVFDIETTGLSKANCKVILAAMLVPTDKGVKVTQFLAEDHYEENLVLDATLSFLKDNQINYLITYNGNHFDLPFINGRLEALHYDATIRLYNLDLYDFFRKYTHLPDMMKSLNQKSVERYFGLESARDDIITGKESVRLYNEYAVDGNPLYEKIILTHNREDVIQLYKLLLCAGQNDFASILKCGTFDEAIGHYGFPINPSSVYPKCTVKSFINARKAILEIRGVQNSKTVSLELFPCDDYPYRASFNERTRSISVDLPLTQYDNDFYVNLKALGLSEKLQGLDSYINGFLILKKDSQVDHFAANALAASLVESLLELYSV